MPAPTSVIETVALARDKWHAQQAAYTGRVGPLLAPHLSRRAAGESHPIEDFLFTYYVYRPNQLRRWHPGIGIDLHDAGDAPHRDWPFYRTHDGVLSIDADDFAQRRKGILKFVRRLMRSSIDRAPSYGCFGMHEWAMVYRQSPLEIRHDSWPLRLQPSQIAATVEDRQLVCTHFDALRFFTDAARPLNRQLLDRDNQLMMEQPGCLHAGMDLYKWAYKLAPVTSSNLVLDCFELAQQIRYVDMQASPYDFSSLGVDPIEVDTPEGRTVYARKQREFAELAAPLRARLLDACDAVLHCA